MIRVNGHDRVNGRDDRDRRYLEDASDLHVESDEEKHLQEDHQKQMPIISRRNISKNGRYIFMILTLRSGLVSSVFFSTGTKNKMK